MCTLLFIINSSKESQLIFGLRCVFSGLKYVCMELFFSPKGSVLCDGTHCQMTQAAAPSRIAGRRI